MDENSVPVDLIFVLEADGTIVDFYQAEGAALYVPAEVFLGKRPEDVLPAHIGQAFRETVERAWKEQRSISFLRSSRVRVSTSSSRRRRARSPSQIRAAISPRASSTTPNKAPSTGLRRAR
ncbi:PAS domain-containing protein [Halochromatium glycolicum]